jgi:hypothetical protein
MSDVATVDVRGGWTSASNALADSLCPGRHNAQKGIPRAPEESNEYRNYGTKVHAALADPDRMREMNLTADEKEMYELCRQVEKDLMASYFADQPAANNGENRVRVWRHVRWWARFKSSLDKTTELTHSGEADMAVRRGVKAMIFDYKSLFGEVPENPKNMQLRDLAVLMKGNLGAIQEIAVAIIQPRVSMFPVPCVYTAADLARAEQDMFDRVSNSNHPGAPRIAGEAQCEYCRARNSCVERQKWAGAMTPPAMLPLLEVPMDQWSVEQRVAALNALKPARKFLDDIEEWAKQGISQDPQFCPGYRLKPGAFREKISNPQACFDRFLKLGGSPERFMETITVQKGALKDAVMEVTGAVGKPLNSMLTELLKDITTKEQNSPSLAKEEK